MSKKNNLLRLFQFSLDVLPERSRLYNDCSDLKNWYITDGFLTDRQLNYLKSIVKTSISFKNASIEFEEQLDIFLNLQEVQTALKLVNAS